MVFNLTSKELNGFTVLAQSLRQPLITKDHISLLYPGSGDRLEHALKIVEIFCGKPEKVNIHLVDPMLSPAVLEKKVVGLDHVEVHVFQENFQIGHIPENLTIYFERAFDIFREDWMIDAVVKKLVPGGLFVSDAPINHPHLKPLPVPPGAKDIGFYPWFGVYQKDSLQPDQRKV
ncbi:MAG TPA: hypothetical protein VJH22_02055 [Candidatus Nanoarchaeia archaeon]|nr:hypothetical protein [Candidatus Nanoarchaeia archaeon]